MGARKGTSWGHLLLLGVLTFIVALSVIVLTTPLHESIHLVISEHIDPYVEVVSFHPFGVPEATEHHRLPSFLGCVIIEGAYPGAFLDRPAWVDPVQEILCIGVQILIAAFVTLRVLSFVSRIKKNASCTST